MTLWLSWKDNNEGTYNDCLMLLYENAGCMTHSGIILEKNSTDFNLDGP